MSTHTEQLHISVFEADLTPLPGEPTMGGLTEPVKFIEHPLYAKGVIFSDKGGISAVCALDYCSLSNATYNQYLNAIASGAGCSPDRVIINNIHFHTSVGPDADAQRTLEAHAPGVHSLTQKYIDDCLKKLRAASEHAASRMQKVRHVQTSWAVVDRAASSRRILRPDGIISTRMSAHNPVDPYNRMLPDGLIDPFLRTIDFINEDGKSIVCLHTYATHPQTSWGNGRISTDAPGIARTRIESETGTTHIYFNGCGGNITMGRYNDRTPEARTALAGRIYDAMRRSLNSRELKSFDTSSLTPCKWTKIPLFFPKRSEEIFSTGYNLRYIHDEEMIIKEARKTGVPETALAAHVNYAKVKAAQIIAVNNRIDAGIPWEVKSASLGPVTFLSLPGETFIEYQLYAQQIASQNTFLITFGYNDCSLWYIGLDSLYTENGGFEISWAFSGPNEKNFKKAITAALKIN